MKVIFHEKFHQVYDQFKGQKYKYKWPADPR